MKERIKISMLGVVTLILIVLSLSSCGTVPMSSTSTQKVYRSNMDTNKDLATYNIIMKMQRDQYSQAFPYHKKKKN